MTLFPRVPRKLELWRETSLSSYLIHLTSVVGLEMSPWLSYNWTDAARLLLGNVVKELLIFFYCGWKAKVGALVLLCHIRKGEYLLVTQKCIKVCLKKGEMEEERRKGRCPDSHQSDLAEPEGRFTPRLPIIYAKKVHLGLVFFLFIPRKDPETQEMPPES